MKIRITCGKHGNCRVTHIGDSLHWIEIIDLDQPRSIINTGTYELEGSDLYCTGGTGDHDFQVTITDAQGDWLAYAEV